MLVSSSATEKQLRVDEQLMLSTLSAFFISPSNIESSSEDRGGGGGITKKRIKVSEEICKSNLVLLLDE